MHQKTFLEGVGAPHRWRRRESDTRRLAAAFRQIEAAVSWASRPWVSPGWRTGDTINVKLPKRYQK